MGQKWVTVANISDRRVDSIFQPGGMGYKFWHKVSEETAENARRIAPVGELWHSHPYPPGNLKKGIRLRYENRTKRRQVVFFVVSTAFYSTWVHEGTDTIEGRMWVPMPPRSRRRDNPRALPKGEGGVGGYRVYRRRVRGQKPQPFLTNAMIDTAQRSRLVRRSGFVGLSGYAYRQYVPRRYR